MPEVIIVPPASPDTREQVLSFLDNVRRSVVEAFEQGLVVKISQQAHTVSIESEAGHRLVGETFSVRIGRV